MILTLYCTPKWIINLNIKIQIVKLLEKNKAENLFDLEVGRNLLEKKYMTQKEPELLKMIS